MVFNLVRVMVGLRVSMVLYYGQGKEERKEG